jgi:gliding motility-associated-like protein
MFALLVLACNVFSRSPDNYRISAGAADTCGKYLATFQPLMRLSRMTPVCFFRPHFVTVLLALAFFLNGKSQETTRYPGCLDSLTIPNVFSPNGDTSIDYWGIYFPCRPDQLTVKVYNRWGEELFKTSDPAFKFYFKDKNGQELPDGTYTYTIEYTYMKAYKSIKGQITLIH